MLAAAEDDDTHLEGTLVKVAAGPTDVPLARTSRAMSRAADVTVGRCLVERHEKKLQHQHGRVVVFAQYCREPKAELGCSTFLFLY